MKIKCRHWVLTASITFLLSVNIEAVETKNGVDIIRRAELNATGFKDMVNRVSMTLIDSEGSVSEREMLIKIITLDEGESKTLTVFTKPSREKGFALLTHSHRSTADDQWLYLPASKRIKKIASNSVGSSFRGSEFTYEDIASQHRDHYRFDYINTESCGEKRCYVIDRFPEFDESSYTKTRLYIDTEYYLVQKGEFFDVKKTLFKTMLATNYIKHKNGVWKPESIVMENHNTHDKTEIRSLELKFDVGLSEREFSKLSLRKIR
ncbi:hypothetical protein A9Q81_07855 [Gammaproteobacteria bacterium 42_54_T18]|nr:hypothetical protein A9Q81_07855 [Gammaproteobacteria bacterium 42_54_T18]